MQLEPGQKSILAYFSNDNQAQQALTQLHEMGYQDVQLDRISRFSNTANNRSMGSLSSMVLGDTDYSRSHPTLMAADPSVSGMSAGNEMAGTMSYLLTVVTDQEHTQEVVDLVNKHGAQV